MSGEEGGVAIIASECRVERLKRRVENCRLDRRQEREATELMGVPERQGTARNAVRSVLILRREVRAQVGKDRIRDGSPPSGPQRGKRDAEHHDHETDRRPERLPPGGASVALALFFRPLRDVGVPRTESHVGSTWRRTAYRANPREAG
jgi:hypothetical protein